MAPSSVRLNSDWGISSLDLADPTESCIVSTMVAPMRSTGKSLTYLNVSKLSLLGDQFLSKGFQPHAKALALPHFPELTDESVSKIFGAWKNLPLISLDISRNTVLGSLSLETLVKHSREQLEKLIIDGWKDVGEPELKLIGRLAKQLKSDVRWCRAVDDFLLKMWFEGGLVQGALKDSCGGRVLLIVFQIICSFFFVAKGAIVLY